MVLFGVVLLSLTGLCLKNAIPDTELSPMAVAGARSLLGVMLWFVFFKTKAWSCSAILIPQKSQIITGIAFAATNITFTYATILTTAHNAVFLQYMAPFWIVLFSFIIWRKPIEEFDFIVLPILLIGMFLVVSEGFQLNNLLGLGLGVFCGICYAFVLIFLGQETSPLLRLKTLLFGNLLTVLIALPFVFSLANISGSAWLWIMLLGVVAFGLPWILFTKALQQITPIEFAVITMIGPVLNPIWVALAPPYEIPGLLPIIGAVLILCGVGYRIYAVSNAKR